MRFQTRADIAIAAAEGNREFAPQGAADRHDTQSGAVTEGHRMGFVIRWAAAFALLAATFNPTPWNYVRWARAEFDAQLPLVVLLGLTLLVGYIIYLRATLRSIGGLGMTLVLALVAALFWVLYDYGILDLSNRDFTVWLGLLALSFVLGIGLSWSLVRRKLSGQADVDDVED
ncbi:DUF6524 family protein [Primorskyibacter marinus]|uniref:DUF6524 family protein n=1 Tax=Primorskyibacter marinus TaxID=1977320 RepID=UPI002FCDA131